MYKEVKRISNRKVDFNFRSIFQLGDLQSAFQYIFTLTQRGEGPHMLFYSPRQQEDFDPLILNAKRMSEV